MKGFSWPLCAAALVLFGLGVSPAAANPSLSGSITLHFALHPDDPETPEVNESFWYFDSWSGGIALGVPILDITTVGAGNFDWNDPSAWTTFPLNTSGLGISHTGSGSYTTVVNNGQANLNVLQGNGPSEGTVQTRVDFSAVHNGPDFSVLSNIATTRYNVTLPTGAHLNDNQIPTLENLTVNAGASVSGSPGSMTIHHNLTNHGSGNFNAVIEGNFINDAVAASGNVANATYVNLDGQLQNTGELRIPQHLQTNAATSNAGTIKLNGGAFHPQAAFANNGTFEFSGGSLNGPGVVTNNGTFDWSGEGHVSGSIVNTTNSFTISGTTMRTLVGTLTNSGTVTLLHGGTFSFGGDAVLTNQSGALFDIIDDNQMYDGGAVGTIHNAGTFRKSGGSGVTVVGPAMNNTGTITVTSGSLRFLQGGTFNGGTMSFANGGMVDLNYGSFFLQGSNSASGDGDLEITSGGAVVIVANGDSASFENFTGGANLVLGGGGELRADTGGTLTLNLTGTSAVKLAGPPGAAGGRIGGAGTTINTGNFEWAYGTVSGNLRNDSVNFTISSTDSHNIEGGTLTNTSTITHSDDGGVYINLGGTLVNQAGALYDITGDGDITAGAITDTVMNAGTFRKSGGSGTSLITAPLTNTGTLGVDSGTMLFAGPDVLTLDPSGTLSFNLAGRDESTEYGKLDMSGDLELDGTFAITLEPGYEPGWGMTFDLLDWQTISGSFDDFELAALSGGRTWNTSQLDVTGVVSVGLPGDFNGNGTVGAEDYVVWRKGLGTTHIPSDYDLWTANFGLPAGGGSSAALGAVPEPATAAMLFMAMLATFCCRRAGGR